MAVARYAVECPGCANGIILRVGVGLDDAQPFFFVCAKCKAATRATQYVSLHPLPTTRLQLEAGEQLESEDSCTQIVTIHPDMPAFADATSMADNGSPFLLQRQLLGADGLRQFQRRLRQFRDIVDHNWISVRRWQTYYLEDDWARFDAVGADLYEEQWPREVDMLQRHDVMHRSLSLVSAPLWIKDTYLRMHEAFVDRLIKNSKQHPALCAYARKRVADGTIKDLQRDVFHCFNLLIENRAAILPGLAAEMYPEGHADAVKKLRLFRDDFPSLRDAYIATFETAHHCLELVFALDNINRRGDENAFTSGKPKDLKTFSKLTSAKKTELLGILPEWQTLWPEVLDRNIRNAIGHHSIRHELSTGMLIMRGKSGLPYLEFVMQCVRVIQAALISANILKYYCILAI